MKLWLSTTAATVTLVFSLSTQAMSAVAQRHSQTKASAITALDRQSSLRLKINSNDPEVYFLQGFLSLLSGDQKGAIANSHQATSINPNYAEAYIKRGFAKVQSGDEKGAIASITIEFHSVEQLHLNLGIMRLLSGDMKGAIEDFNQAILINPNYAEAYKGRGVAKVQLGEEKEAIEDLQKAADIFQQQEETAEYQELINIIKQIKDN